MKKHVVKGIIIFAVLICSISQVYSSVTIRFRRPRPGPSIVIYRRHPQAVIVWHPQPAPVINTVVVANPVIVQRKFSPGHGLLSIDVSPPDADVYLGSKFIGLAGNLSKVPPRIITTGYHRITIYKSGYKAAKFDIHIEAGKETKVSYSLVSV